MPTFAFVSPVSDMDVARGNLLASQALRSGEHEVILSQGYTNVSKALNDGIAKVTADLVCCVHQDVYLPPEWEAEFRKSIIRMDQVDPGWGVLGVAGVRLTDDVKELLGYVNDRGRIFGWPSSLPQEVETLDELLLVLRRGSFSFDEDLTYHHLYGTDVCMQARAAGRSNYVIKAYCYHNCDDDPSQPPGYLPPEFEACKDYLRHKWADYLPIPTCCDLIGDELSPSIAS